MLPSPRSRVPATPARWPGKPSPLAESSQRPTRPAAYDGIYIQTPGTGGDLDLGTHDASDGVFVYSKTFAGEVKVGDHVEVTGRVSEFRGLTEISPPAGSWTVLDEPAEAVKPAEVDFPLDDAQRESLEGMLLGPSGDYTITNNFTTNQYAEIGLAAGDEPLQSPTNVARPLSAEYDQVVAENAAPARHARRRREPELPQLGQPGHADPVAASGQRGAGRSTDVVHRSDGARLPQRPLEAPADGTAGGGRSGAGDVRQHATGRTGERPRHDADRDVQRAELLHTLGEDYAASGAGTCTYFRDRDGNNLTVNSCTNNGPRGAANAANLERQQAKIVAAINQLGADVVSLEEIENSAAFGIDRDTALRHLVEALNADAGAGTWDYVRSPRRVPEVEDVIRTAFIYRTDAVRPRGQSTILDVPAFDNAREPLAQEFRPSRAGSKDDFVVIVNHFKSKSSGSGEDADQGDGQGASNASRVKQAHALVEFAEEQQRKARTERVFLTGDFNAYDEEDPVQVIEEAGYTNVTRELTDKETYQFDGLVGSLDHVFASRAAFETVTDADIWNISAYESVGREYSRFNTNVTNLYTPGPYRSSDHDPEIVGFVTRGRGPR